MANRDRPDDLCADDLDAVTDELASVYFSGVMISYLTCVFMNSAYVQPCNEGAAGRTTRNEY